MRRTYIGLVSAGLIVTAVSLMMVLPSGADKAPGQIQVERPDITWVSSGTEAEGQTHTATADFTFRNDGGRPVRMLGTSASCGCATPVVSPTILAPGATGKMHVAALPPAVGERIVTFELETDSPVTKTVNFTLRLVGNRKPPFLLRLTGDFSYLSSDFRNDTRELQAVTIISGDTERRDPLVRCDLPFIRIEPSGVAEGPYATSDALQRVYSYRVVPTGEPETEHFSGVIRVIDPWDAGNALTLPIHGEATRSIRWLPSVLTFQLPTSGEQDPRGLVIITADPSPDLTLIPGENSPLRVERDGARRSDRFHRFRVTLDQSKPISDAPCFLTVVPRPDAAPSETARVPVKLER